MWLDSPFLNATDTMDFQDYGYVCHLNENMILPKLSDDVLKPLVCQNPASVKHVLREHVHVGSQDSHAVYSVDVQIMRIKDVKIPTLQGQHKIYLPCFLLYHALAVSLYNIVMSKYIMYIFQLLYTQFFYKLRSISLAYR